MSNDKGKIIGIAGSARRKSNSMQLLTSALDGCKSAGADTELINILDLHYSGCQACLDCHRTGKCIIDDDITPIYAKLASARAVIIAAPVYFYGLPGQFKLFIDRFQAVWANQPSVPAAGAPKRVGGLISTCGSIGLKSFEGLTMTVKYFYSVQGITLTEPLLFKNFDSNPDKISLAVTMSAAKFGKLIAGLSM